MQKPVWTITGQSLHVSYIMMNIKETETKADANILNSAYIEAEGVMFLGCLYI